MPRSANAAVWRMPLCSLALGLVAGLWPGAACVAQDAADEKLVVYQHADFARFTPRTALDIVQLVPGFAFEEMVETRGLSTGGGNVLIDGKRPTAKSGGLAEVLSRIPAAGVARVEVSRGGGSETQGQALVVNIVRAAGRRRGAWSLQLERPANQSQVNLTGEASMTRDVAGWDITAKVEGLQRRTVYTYYHRRAFGADGVLRQYQEEVSPRVGAEAFVSADAARTLGEGHLTLTVRMGGEASTRDRDRVNFASDDPSAPSLSGQNLGDDITTLTGELGAEWVRADLQGWTLKLVGLGSWDQVEREQWSQDSGGLQRSSFRNHDTAIEAVSRMSLSRTAAAALAPEIGAEVAFNRLDSLVISALELNGVPVLSATSREDIRVEELRGEAFANFKWALSPRLTAEGGLAAELSQISVGGDRSNRETFTFVKPSAALSYRFQDGVQARLALQRTVGQLDFTNFAASTSFSDGWTAAGAPQLAPERIWRASGSLDIRSEKRGALNLEVFYERIDGALEQAILNDQGGLGLANLGSAKRWGVTARGTLPLTRLIPGARLEANLKWKDSRFEDPLTGQARTLTYFTPFAANLAFRQDLPDLRVSWGVKALFREQDKWWFVNERNFRYRAAQYSAFVETTRFLGLKARLDVENIGQHRHGETRTFYRPDRTAPLQSMQVSRRADSQWVKLTLSRQF